MAKGGAGVKKKRPAAKAAPKKLDLARFKPDPARIKALLGGVGGLFQKIPLGPLLGAFAKLKALLPKKKEKTDQAAAEMFDADELAAEVQREAEVKVMEAAKDQAGESAPAPADAPEPETKQQDTPSEPAASETAAAFEMSPEEAALAGLDLETPPTEGVDTPKPDASLPESFPDEIPEMLPDIAPAPELPGGFTGIKSAFGAAFRALLRRRRIETLDDDPDAEIRERLLAKRGLAFMGAIVGMPILLAIGLWIGLSPSHKSPPQETFTVDPRIPRISLPLPPRVGPEQTALLTPTTPPNTGVTQPASMPPNAPSGAPTETTTTTPNAPLEPVNAQPAPAAPLTAPSETLAAPTETPAKPESGEAATAPTDQASEQDAGPKKPVIVRRGTSLARASGEPPAPLPLKGAAPQIPDLAGLASLGQAKALPSAPVTDMLRRGPGGLLPIIASDGRKPWQVYARPFPKEETRPKLALVVYDLGLSKEATEIAIAKLPPEVTLAFNPYVDKLDDWVKKARANGHEVLLGLPLEPAGFPQRDPGPWTLLALLTPDDNARRLETVLGRMSGYVGVLGMQGSRFLTQAPMLALLFKNLQDRGLLFVDNGGVADSQTLDLAAKAGLPHAVATAIIDDRPFRAAIDARLAKAEAAARANGAAVALAGPRPVSLERIVEYARDMAKKGVVLAPVSAVVKERSP